MNQFPRISRPWAVLAGAAAVSLGVAAMADDVPAGSDHGHRFEFPVSVAQARQQAEARFEKLDADGNGEVSAAELAAAPMPGWGPGHRGLHHGDFHVGGMSPGAPHGKADQEVSSDQRDAWEQKHQAAEQAMDADIFKRLDADGDGQLSRTEFAADKLRAARRDVFQARMFAHLDKDGSGGLSRDELPDRTRWLEAMDTDHDGTVTRDEARSHHHDRQAAPAGDDQG